MLQWPDVALFYGFTKIYNIICGNVVYFFGFENIYNLGSFSRCLRSGFQLKCCNFSRLIQNYTTFSPWGF